MFSFFKKEQPEVVERVVYKDAPQTDEEKFLVFAEFIGDVNELKMDTKYEERLFKDLSNVDYLHDYLRDCIARDMQRYFAATNDEQRQLIKGAIARTSYLRSRIIKQPDNEVVQTKMKGLRYSA